MRRVVIIIIGAAAAILSIFSFAAYSGYIKLDDISVPVAGGLSPVDRIPVPDDKKAVPSDPTASSSSSVEVPIMAAVSSTMPAKKKVLIMAGVIVAVVVFIIATALIWSNFGDNILKVVNKKAYAKRMEEKREAEELEAQKVNEEWGRSLWDAKLGTMVFFFVLTAGSIHFRLYFGLGKAVSVLLLIAYLALSIVCLYFFEHYFPANGRLVFVAISTAAFSVGLANLLLTLPSQKPEGLLLLGSSVILLISLLV